MIRAHRRSRRPTRHGFVLLVVLVIVALLALSAYTFSDLMVTENQSASCTASNCRLGRWWIRAWPTSGIFSSWMTSLDRIWAAATTTRNSSRVNWSSTTFRPLAEAALRLSPPNRIRWATWAAAGSASRTNRAV